MIRFRVALCAAILGAALATRAAAQQSDVIRGRVTGPDSLPLQNVVVTATSIAGNVNRTARTDKNGRYTITFSGADGDYMLSVAALGYAVKRFEVKRVAVACPSFVADCLETLEEIGIRAHNNFIRAGGEELRLVPSLNSEPAWVAAVVGWIRELCV